MAIAVLILIIAAIIFAIWYRQHPKAGSIEARVSAITNHWADSAGFVVELETGARVSDAELHAIEKGLQRTFTKAACAGYTKSLEFSGYTIAILKGVPDSAGKPALQIPVGAYKGSEWDKGDFMLVAGLTLDPANKLIVIPEHNGDVEHLARISEFEAEHVVLYANNRAEYERTAVHGPGTGHPLLEDCP